jgi:hypothetical protein
MQQINVVLPVGGLRPANEISIRGGSRPRYTAVGAPAMFHSHIPGLQFARSTCLWPRPAVSKPEAELNSALDRLVQAASAVRVVRAGW